MTLLHSADAGSRLGRWARIRLPQGLRDALTLGRGLEPALAGLAGEGAPDPDRPPLACVFCGARTHVMRHRGKGICVDCVREIREMVSGG